MRRSFAAISIARNVSAVVLSMLLAPVTPSLSASLHGEAAIELLEGPADSATICPQRAPACEAEPEAVTARAYLVETAHPGGTMMRQGPDVAIGRLHPEFVLRLAGAVREARDAGLEQAGIFSAYRRPAFGVGGFSDKFNSLHAYGLAVDMYGIGRPGSSEAKLWTGIAAKHGVVCPYGVNHRVEWNH